VAARPPRQLKTSRTAWVAQEYGANTSHLAVSTLRFRLVGPCRTAGQIPNIGCGVGDFTVQLVGAGRAVLGVDPSEALLADALQRFGDRVPGQLPDVLRILESELVQRGLRHAPWYFADSHDLATLITSAGLTTARGRLRTVAQRRLYGRDELLGWLSSQIVIAYESLMNKGEFALFRGAIARRCVAELERESDRYVVEFRRLDVLAHRV
jgi:hypothetical protein